MLEYFVSELLFTPAEVVHLIALELKPRMDALEHFYKQHKEESSPHIVDEFKELFIDLAKELADELALFNFGLGYRKRFTLASFLDEKTYEFVPDIADKLRTIEEYCLAQPADGFGSLEESKKCFELFVQFSQAVVNTGMRLVVALNIPHDEISNAFLGTGKYRFPQGDIQ